MFYASELVLGPPQIYEMCRLLQFPNLNAMEVYTSERVEKGVECWMPVNYSMSDGFLSTMIGMQYHVIFIYLFNMISVFAS